MKRRFGQLFVIFWAGMLLLAAFSGAMAQDDDFEFVDLPEFAPSADTMNSADDPGTVDDASELTGAADDLAIVDNSTDLTNIADDPAIIDNASDLTDSGENPEIVDNASEFTELPDDPGIVEITEAPADDGFEFVDIPEEDFGNSGGFEFIDDPVSDDEFEIIDDPNFEDEFEFIDDPNFDDDIEFVDDPAYTDTADPLPNDLTNITEEDALADPDLLLQVADELFFPRVGPDETFWQTQGYLNEVLEGDIIYQYYVRGGMASEVLMSMFPAEISLRAGHLRPSVTRAWEKDYHVTITVLRAEDIPNGSGGCWLRYSNVRSKGEGGESGLILFPEREAFAITSAGNHHDLVYTPVESLAGLNLNNNIKFDFIRLDGVTFIYANGKYLFSYEDGFNGNMSFEGGVDIYEGGNRVRCDFDNFSMRYR